MVLEAFSVAAFGAFIWAVTFMVPKAIKQRDGLAITSAVVTAVFALIAWILASVPLSGRCDFSSPPHPPYSATRFVDVAIPVVPGNASETVPEMISAGELPGNDRDPLGIGEGP